MKPLCAITFSLSLLATAATPQPSASIGSVKGKVVCEDTHGPARGAFVSLQAAIKSGAFAPPGGGFGATTGLDGSFKISNVTPGEYYLIATYPGYISAKEYIFPGALSPELSGSRQPLPSFVHRVTVASGNTVDAEIRLKKGGAISGSVAHSDGAPVPNVALNPVVRMRNGNFARVLSLAHTDGTGHYRIDGLPDGSYAVMAALEGEMVTVFGGDRIGSSGLMTFAGGGLRPSKARIVVVTSPNEHAGVNVTFPLNGVHEIAGTVSAPDGHRLNHSLVRLYPTGEPLFSLTTPLAADGTFRFHRVSPDSYTVRVEDASDWKIVPKTNGAVRYGERTLLRSFGPGTVDIKVADADVAKVSVTVSPGR